MAVDPTTNHIIYLTDGIETNYQFPYYLFGIGDLIVQGWPIADATDITTYEVVVDYFISPAADAFGSFPTGLFLAFHFAPPALGALLIQRHTSQSQLTTFVDNSPFTAGSLNSALDKLTLMVQDIGFQIKGFVNNVPPNAPGPTYDRGDVFINNAPAVGGYYGFVCVSPGSPGTWAGFGLIVTL